MNRDVPYQPGKLHPDPFLTGKKCTPTAVPSPTGKIASWLFSHREKIALRRPLPHRKNCTTIPPSQGKIALTFASLIRKVFL
jgi:hypothetical protein